MQHLKQSSFTNNNSGNIDVSQKVEKMQINDSHIVNQKHDKVILQSLEITPSPFDIEFKQDLYSGRQMIGDLYIRNISGSIVSFRLKCNNVKNYNLSSVSKILQPKEEIGIQIAIRNMENVRVQTDKFLVQALPLEDLMSIDPAKIWSDKQYLLHKQIEERILKVKIASDLLKLTSPMKSNEKQQFIQEFFYGSQGIDGVASSLILSNKLPINSNSTHNDSNTLQNSNRITSSSPIFSQKLASLNSPLHRQFPTISGDMTGKYSQYSNSNKKDTILNSSRNGSFPSLKSTHSTQGIGKSKFGISSQYQGYENYNSPRGNQSMISQQYYSTMGDNICINNVVINEENIKSLYEQLLIYVDKQEKQMSQLAEERKCLREQLSHFYGEEENGKTKKKNTKQVSRFSNLQESQGINKRITQSNQNQQFQPTAYHNNNKQDSRKGIKTWQAILLLVLIFLIGQLHANLSLENQELQVPNIK